MGAAGPARRRYSIYCSENVGFVSVHAKQGPKLAFDPGITFLVLDSAWWIRFIVENVPFARESGSSHERRRSLEIECITAGNSLAVCLDLSEDMFGVLYRERQSRIPHARR